MDSLLFIAELEYATTFFPSRFGPNIFLLEEFQSNVDPIRNYDSSRNANTLGLVWDLH